MSGPAVPAEAVPPQASSLQLSVLGGVRASRDGDDLGLGGPRPRALLAALVVAAGRPATEDLLIDAVWDTSWVGDERIVDVHIGHLRRKLGEEPDGGGLIETVRGGGYRSAEFG